MNVSGIMMNGGWLDHLWQMSWQAGVLVLLVLAVQTLLGSRLAARWRYALWFLVLARLLLPSLPESRTSIYRMPTLSPSAEQTARLSAEVAGKITGLYLNADADGGKSTLTVRAFDWRRWFTAGWLTGVVTLGGLTVWRQTRLIRRLRGMKPPADGDTADLLAACAREMKISKPPLMVETGLVSSPAVVGLWRPTLLLPVGLSARFSREELRVVFLHELAHMRRGDLWVETLMMTLQILHWFNPLIWLGFWRMRRDRELATDALVLAEERAGLKYLYGNTLIRLVENAPPPRRWQRVVGMTENAASLKSRLLRIKQMAAGAYGWSLLGVALLAIISVVALVRVPVPEKKTALSAAASKEKVQEYVAGILRKVPFMANSSLQDAEIEQLKKVGADNIDVLLAANDEFGKKNAHCNYYLSMAVEQLARPQDKELIVSALPRNRYLVYAVLRMGWARDARDELLRVFREEPGKFAPGWIEAIATLHDPSTYAELRQYLIHGQHRGHTYNALKKNPDIGDLRETVAQAWPVAKNGNENEARDMAKIAASYEIADAAEFLHNREMQKSTVKPPTDLMSGDDYTNEYLAGTKITAAQAAELEKQVAADGENMATRAKLLGYYMRLRITQTAARDAAQVHILWLINFRPESQLAGSPEAQVNKNMDEKCYAEAAAAWERQLQKQPDKMRILNNAARFFLLSDADRAEKLWKHALALEPENSAVAEQLAHLYQLKTINSSGEQARKNLAAALAFNEKALQGAGNEERFYQLPKTAMAAYRAGDLLKAEQYAREALTLTASFENWNTGNAVYAGNHVLGLVALEKNDVAAAKKFLLLAGDSKGSPQLDSFGPNLLLAQKLLERGERETVLEFLGKIEKFWEMGKERIISWKQDIRAGKTVQLGNKQY